MMVVGITGHQNIPASALDFINAEIDRALQPFKSDLIGVSSLAEGSDQLFARAVLRLGGRLHVVIPCSKYEDAFKDDLLIKNYHKLLSSAEEVETLDYPIPSEKAFLDAGRRIVEISKILIAVWDGQEAKGKGGTADIVNYAREIKKEVHVVWPLGLKRE